VAAGAALTQTVGRCPIGTNAMIGIKPAIMSRIGALFDLSNLALYCNRS